MEIRPARPEDVPAVLPMVAKVCAFHEALDPAKYGFLPEPERRYERWLGARAADDRSVFLVADAAADGRPPSRLVAFLVGTVEEEIPIYRIERFGLGALPRVEVTALGDGMWQVRWEHLSQTVAPMTRNGWCAWLEENVGSLDAGDLETTES